MQYELPLEILRHIASNNETTWYHLTLISPLFRQYAYSNSGRDEFEDLFAVAAIKKDLLIIESTWKLLGKIHRGRDRPARIIKIDVGKYGYIDTVGESTTGCSTVHTYEIGGEMYRANDRPTVEGFYENGALALQIWDWGLYFYRENNLPIRVTYHPDYTPLEVPRVRSEWWYGNSGDEELQDHLILYNKDGEILSKSPAF